MVGWDQLRLAAFQEAPECQFTGQVKLPVVPQCVIRFTHEADRREADVYKLSQILESDSALTAELLRHVNSALTGLRARVQSVRSALMAVGIRRSKALVLTAALRNATKSVKSPLIPANRFQEENVERALFALETARVLGRDMELAYLGGMVQDLILPHLTAIHRDAYQHFSHDIPLASFERSTFNWDHAVAAARLLNQWGFPDELTLGVLYHHDLERILARDELKNSAILPIAAAALLPDCLGQSPDGLMMLLTLQEELPGFQFLEIAAAVDDAISAFETTDENRVPLCERLGNLAMQHLEQHRQDTVVMQKHIGHYFLEGEIGRGGMGVVYRARHDMLKRPAALKLLLSPDLTPNMIQRFEEEVQRTSQLTNPNTIGIYDYGVTPAGLFYYAMEFIDGITLMRLVQQYGPQREGRVIHLLLQACHSIADAHANGLIHRDIKPENIMVASRGGVNDMVKVLDFGLAKPAKALSQADSAYGMSGTPLYMAPDAMTPPFIVDARTDIYSLGAVAYFLLTGEPVFTGDDVREILTQHATVAPMPPSLRSGRTVADDLEQIILKCLAKRPAERFQSASELIDALHACRSAKEWTLRDAAAWWGEHKDVVASSSIAPLHPSDVETMLVPKALLEEISKRAVATAK
ncbi:Serine/threonine-protein kinase PknB [Planctomyces sp. SH-PL14]|nr:Serine/threonine-protein kinase PknB [Planctomyces sp. SH-PL14]